jgi:hypothetical protein
MPEFPDTSHSLIARVKDPGDGVAWAEFLGIYQPVVYVARYRVISRLKEKVLEVTQLWDL